MNKFLSISLLLLFSASAWGQSNPYQIQFSHQIEAQMADGSLRASRAGLLYSLIGEYFLANSYSDIPISWGIDSLNVDSYFIKEAIEPIIEEAKDKRIVIISENHLKPQHRVFAKQIIIQLAKHGFHHLGLETLGNESNGNTLRDKDLMNRGYPLDSPLTGTYTLEPKMGDLVRNAIHNKYSLFAYERSEKIKGKDRDEIQADNIIRYIESHPNEKVIILCGFHHAIESNIKKRGKSYWMAKYVKDKTGIDPLTIYQDNFTEKFIENEHPTLQKIDISKPSVFVDENEQIVRLSEHVDIEVIHPNTRYLNNRPNWLYENKAYKSVDVIIDRNETKFPIIVSAYLKDEKDAVPIDRFELKHKYDKKALILPPGEYRIQFYDGTTYSDYDHSVN